MLGIWGKRDFHSFSNFSRNSGQVTCVSFIHNSPSPPNIEIISKEHEVFIALGSNLGDRLQNFYEAIHSMKKSGVNITRHGCLYETEPAYVTNQPPFLNSVIRGFTKLKPHDLLTLLKTIEKQMGRTDGIRYGPRPIDLDILFYGKIKIRSENLTIPHEKLWERPFVIAPLVDVLGSEIDRDMIASWHSFSPHSETLFELWDKLQSPFGKKGIRRVLPIKNRLWDWSQKTTVMGILNLTPDSFSDGGKFQSIEAAISRVRLMVSEGADIIDIGAQSTRPISPRVRVSPQEELDRLIPILDAILKMPEVTDTEILLSIDTFYSEVASEAIQRGAHLVNDVSGGKFDIGMHRVVSDLRVPYVATHMRGDLSTMQDPINLNYDNICLEIGLELCARVREAELAGIPVWSIILDPGIGFSKSTEQNLEILMGIRNIRAEIAKRSLGCSRGPLLIGASRKRFLGEICGRLDAGDRDPATVACVTAAVLGGADMVRVHNVGYNYDAVKLCDAMAHHKRYFCNFINHAIRETT